MHRAHCLVHNYALPPPATAVLKAEGAKGLGLRGGALLMDKVVHSMRRFVDDGEVLLAVMMGAHPTNNPRQYVGQHGSLRMITFWLCDRCAWSTGM